MNELALFAGAGGGILGSKLLGWRTVCAVEKEPYRRSVLCKRQNEGILEPFPIWDDVRTFDGKPWRSIVDIISGGFPCQDISCAGTGDGLNGTRSGLWEEMRRIISEVRSRFIFVENSPMLLVRGIERILGDLAALGYNCAWGTFSGRHVGAPIERERIFIAGSNQIDGKEGLGDFKPEGPVFKTCGGERPSLWLQTPPVDFGVVDGVDSYVDQVSAIGDGQIPAVVCFAWHVLCQRIGQKK